MSTPSCSAICCALPAGRTLKPTTTRRRRLGEADVGLGDAADAGRDDVHARPCSVDSRVSAFATASTEPCTSALSTTLTSLTSPDLILSRMFSSDTRLGARQLLLAPRVVPVLGERLGRLLVGDDVEHVARVGDAVQAQDLDRRRRAGLGQRLSLVAEHGADLPRSTRPRRPGRRRAACPPRPGWSRWRRARDRAAPRRRAPWPPCSGWRAARASRPAAPASRAACRCPAWSSPTRSRRSSSPPHSSGTRSYSDSLCASCSGLAPGLSILLTATTMRDLRRLGVVDRLDRLRHRPVVGGDDQHDDVGHLGAARTHRRERLVAGRIQEHDVAALARHLVGADVLRDAAGLARRRRSPCGSRRAATSCRGRRGP